MHTMTSHGNGLWSCPDCGRRIRIHRDHIETIIEGDPVPHQGGNLAVTLEVEPSVPDEFRRFLDNID